MKKIIFFFAFLVPILAAAQNNGVAFQNQISWPEIMQRAKQQNKYIFVDCYASWCGPCELMDKNVYSNDTVGEFLSDKFISVKIQLDSTKNDAVSVREWYRTARIFSDLYHIRSFPTFLFFAPDGHIVHRAVGGRTVNEFVTLATTALDPNQQFYSRVSQYQEGDRTLELAAYLIETAYKIGEDSVAKSISDSYMHQYLPSLPDTTFFTKENIGFIVKNSDSLKPSDVLFRRIMFNQKKVNLVMSEDRYADGLINKVIYNSEIMPELKKWLVDSTLVNWHEIGHQIAKEYGRKYIKHNLIFGQLRFYRAKRNWQKYASALVAQRAEIPIRSLPVDGVTALFLNNDAYSVFNYSKNRKELKTALKWVVTAISMEEKPTANEMDTKANLLYKLGRRKAGISLEAESHDLAPKDQEITANYNKMKSGLPTWQ